MATDVLYPEFAPDFPRLDLGSGPKPWPGFTGVDKKQYPGGLVWDFASASPWPWRTESVEALRSSHLIEHLPPVDSLGRDVFFRFFSEAYRVCKPGARFDLFWPVPFHPKTGLPIPSAWQDPTHYRHIPHDALAYLSVEGRRQNGVEGYSIACNWVLIAPVTVRELTEDGSVLDYHAVLERRPPPVWADPEPSP